MHETIEVFMLGNFHLRYKDIIVTESAKSSKKIWTLLEYLIYYNNRPSTDKELVDLLWPNNSSSNPANALKNLIFRLRQLLKELGITCYDSIIIYKNSKVTWNKEILCKCDFYRFDELSKSILNPITNRELIKSQALEAISIYKGDFLTNRSSENWVIPIRNYFKSLYIDITGILIDILIEDKEYNNLLDICKNAIDIMPTEEKFHYGFILANQKLGNKEIAINHYTEIKKHFYDNLCRELSDEFHSLYQEIVRSIHDYEKDLDQIKLQLDNSLSTANGCIECEYEVFKNIYAMNTRIREGQNNNNFLVLMSIVPIYNKYSGDNNNLITIKIKLLRKILKNSLRMGDIITRYSGNQYILILNNVETLEDMSKITDRITQSFYNSDIDDYVELVIDYLKL